MAKGDCYEANARWIWLNNNKPDINEYTLVHGVAIGQKGTEIENMEFGHCWIEKGEMIFDHSNNRNISVPKVLYYAIGQIFEMQKKYKFYRYKLSDIIKFMMKTKNWGPWEGYFPNLKNKLRVKK